VANALSLDVAAVVQAPLAQLAQRRNWRAATKASKSARSFLAWPIDEPTGIWREPSGRQEAICARLDLAAAPKRAP